MTTFEALDAAWQGREPILDGKVHVLVRRTARGVHDTPEEIHCEPNAGIIGDRWSVDGEGVIGAQVSLIPASVCQLLCDRKGVPWHTPGDNLVAGIDLSESAVPVGARLKIGGAELEVTDEPHLGCQKFSDRLGRDAFLWVNDKAGRFERRRGVYCKINRGGAIALGDVIEVLPPEG